MTDLSWRSLLAIYALAAAIIFASGLLVGAMLMVGTCSAAPRLSPAGQYLGPELRCPVPPWVRIGTAQ